jgi:hypothetical protein
MNPHNVTAAITAAIITTAPAATTITYEEVILGPQGYLNNAPYSAAGVTHTNGFTDWGGGFTSWSGFALSNKGDTTTAGFGNQYSSYTGGAAGGTQFAVGYVDDFFAPGGTRLIFATTTNLTGMGADFTNTTYAALSMLSGDGFAVKFGGADGTLEDTMVLTLTGKLGGATTGSTSLYLGDYRGTTDMILNTWSHVDFTPLGTVDEIVFSMPTTNPGTPTYFAMDNLVVPEPSALILGSAAGVLLLRRRRSHQQVRPIAIP